MNALLDWEFNHSRPELGNDEVHIWRMAVPATHAGLTIRPLLSPAEQTQAQRFRFERDQVRYVLTHTALRHILSAYLELSAEALEFMHNSHGKPYLSGKGLSRQVQFNLSHSAQAALVAVSAAGEVGVDIEHKRPDFAAAEIAERFFAPQEFASFRSLPEGQRVDGFFNAWTRKEAYIKARGKGLAIQLDSFQVTLIPGHPARLEWDRDDPQAVQRWQMAAIEAGQEYAAAVCFPVEVKRWRGFYWPPA